jgi:6-phosphogluconolactonase
MAAVERDVRVFRDLEDLSQAAATIFTVASGEAIAGRGRFLVVLSGGSTPLRLYEILSQSPFKGDSDWQHIHAFWGDERIVPLDDPESNYHGAHDLLLSRVPVPAENIHSVRTDLEPEAAAEEYANVLGRYATPPLRWPRFDLVLLGLGEDGHTASLFPGSPWDGERPVMAVNAHYQDRPAWRVTLTPPVFNSARRILFLVSGRSKARVLADVLYGEQRPEVLPAQSIHPEEGELIWMVDRGAAGEL